MIIGEIDSIGAKYQTYQFKCVNSINGKPEKISHISMVQEVVSIRIILVLVNHSPLKKKGIIQNCEKWTGHLQKKWIKR